MNNYSISRQTSTRGALGGPLPRVGAAGVLEVAASLGGVITRTVNLETGEVETGGLSYTHSSRKEGAVTFYLGGSLMEVEKPHFEQPQKGGGKRGGITQFSNGSRRRMLKMMAKTELQSHPLMVTLTYPGEFPGEPKVWKKHLKNWLQRLKYHFPGVGGVWKLEPQKRGAPHYHLLVWGVAGEFWCFTEWVKRSWFEVVNSGDIKHLHAGTRVEAIRSERGVMAYAGKYVGKTTQKMELGEDLQKAWGEAGKWWGVFGMENIPWASAVTSALPLNMVYQVMRLMRRAGHLKARQYQSLALFCAADFWFEKYNQMLE